LTEKDKEDRKCTFYVRYLWL